MTIPEGCKSYKKTPVFTEETVPAGLLNDHATKAGVWGLLTVLEGSLEYVIPSKNHKKTVTPDIQAVIEPEILHHVKPLGLVRFFVEFWR